MTVTDLLESKEFKYNQTSLAITLNINRGTLRRYMEDTKGEFHFVCRTSKNAYNFFTNQTRKITDENNTSNANSDNTIRMRKHQ